MASAKRKAINANIILYGPTQAGKSSNIQFIHRKLKRSQRGEISTLCQDGYPQVSYEFLPIELGELKGYDTNLYIYTAPAHDDGLETRLNLLNEAAGVIFIADSDPGRLDDNVESLTNLKEELRWWDIDHTDFPIVFQFNKRDLPDALSLEELERQLNPEGREEFEAIASAGHGVRDTFALISKMAVRRVRLRLIKQKTGAEGEGGSVRKAAGSQDDSGPRLQLVHSGPGREAQSEVTLDTAPPPREEGDESDESDSYDSEEFEVSDSDRGEAHGETAPASAGEASGGKMEPLQDDLPTDHEGAGVDAHEKKHDTEEEDRSDSLEEQETSSKKRSSDADGKERESDDIEDDQEFAEEARPEDAEEESSGEISGPDDGSRDLDGHLEADAEMANALAREDFLKTAFSFDTDDEPLVVGTVEAGEAIEVEVEAEEDEADVDIEDVSTGTVEQEQPESLGKISLPDGPSLAALSFDISGEADVKIQTYADDEEEDNDEPIIRLGSHSLDDEEELQLDDDMLMDDDDFEVEVIEEDSSLAGSEMESEQTAEAALGTSGEQSAELEQDPAIEIDDLADVDDGEVSDPGGEEAMIDVSAETGGLDLPFDTDSLELEQGASDEGPGRGEDLEPSPDSDPPGDDVASTETYPQEMQGHSDDSTAGEPSGGTGRTDIEEPTSAEATLDLPDGAVGEVPSQVLDLSDDALSNEDTEIGDQASLDDASEDARTEPVEDEGLDTSETTGEDDASALVAELRQDSTEDEDIFESVVGEPVDEEEVDAGEGDASLEEAQRTAAAEEAAEEATKELEVVDWGEVTRVDSRTLRIPVNVCMPGSSKEVLLAVTLKVDQLLEAIDPEIS